MERWLQTRLLIAYSLCLRAAICMTYRWNTISTVTVYIRIFITRAAEGTATTAVAIFVAPYKPTRGDGHLALAAHRGTIARNLDLCLKHRNQHTGEEGASRRKYGYIIGPSQTIEIHKENQYAASPFTST